MYIYICIRVHVHVHVHVYVYAYVYTVYVYIYIYRESHVKPQPMKPKSPRLSQTLISVGPRLIGAILAFLLDSCFAWRLLPGGADPEIHI